MSQAVSAPITGAVVSAPGNSAYIAAPSAGKDAPESPSRRTVLAGMALVPVAAASVSVPAAQAREWVDPVILSRRADPDFWRAFDRQKKIHRHWMAAYDKLRGSPQLDDVTSRWCTRHHEAECEMVQARVSTLPALFAKLSAIRDLEMDYGEAMDGGFAPQDHILFDIERMMKREYRC